MMLMHQSGFEPIDLSLTYLRMPDYLQRSKPGARLSRFLHLALSVHGWMSGAPLHAIRVDASSGHLSFLPKSRRE